MTAAKVTSSPHSYTLSTPTADCDDHAHYDYCGYRFVQATYAARGNSHLKLRGSRTAADITPETQTFEEAAKKELYAFPLNADKLNDELIRDSYFCWWRLQKLTVSVIDHLSPRGAVHAHSRAL